MNWRRLLAYKFLLIGLAFFAYFALADAPEVLKVESRGPVLQVATSTAPALTAVAYLVVDVETGAVVVAANENMVLPIASVTKLFTASALEREFDLGSIVKVISSDVASPEPFGKLQVNEDYLLRELMFPLLLESSNDAATVFERQTKGEVIKVMNQLVDEVGMDSTLLVDASGLSPKNVSTAADLTRFLRYLAESQPHVLDITTLTQYVGPYTGWVNNSPVRDQSFKGGKHGYTIEAGRTLAAIFGESLQSGERDFSYVLLGSKDLASDTKALRHFVVENVVFE